MLTIRISNNGTIFRNPYNSLLDNWGDICIVKFKQ